VFESRGMGVFGSKERGVAGDYDNYIIRSFMVCTSEQILLG
jgi:uncharacterized membrane protein YqgA involved in biofilm formation